MERIKYTTPYYDETLTGAYTMKSGETIIFETPDCWGNALTEAITKGELYAKGLEMNPCGGPVQVEGAKLITGDVHALQGNGEVLASLEIPAKITLKVELIKGRQEKWPVLETEDSWSMITSGLTSDEANTYAMDAMAEFLTRRGTKNNLEWLTFMGLVGEANICKVVDTYKTSRFTMKKMYTEGIEF